jgi:hypothetical protein
MSAMASERCTTLTASDLKATGKMGRSTARALTCGRMAPSTW